MRAARIFAWIAILSLALAACAPAPGAEPPANTPAETPAGTQAPAPSQAPRDLEQPEAVRKAGAALAAQLGIDPAQVQVRSAAPAEWPDACLGLPAAGEMCAQAITPGYGGLLAAGEEQYEFRTDQTGQAVRLVPGAALSARQVLAQQLHLDPEQVRIQSSERVEWPDACLGAPAKGRACAQVVTPGYRVTLAAGGETYEVHTDLTGGSTVLASAPAAGQPDAPIAWQQSGETCQRALIGSDAVVFGPCAGSQGRGKLASPERQEELADFVNTFASFTARTPAGQVTLAGAGQQQASPAEQRMVAEWARLVYLEAEGGRGGAAWGLAFAWRREGGLAGFCDDLAVYVTGWASATSCKGRQPQDLGKFRLAAGQLEQLYAWVDAYRPFELEQKDPATADAMTIRLVFSGAGRQDPGQAEKQAIEQFAAGLFAAAGQGRASASEAEALQDYFTALNAGDYPAAAQLYGGDYAILAGYNPTLPKDDHAALFEAGCRSNGLQCNLVLRDVVEVEKMSPLVYRFTVTFSDPDGGLFSQGPCCGADPTTTPPVRQFQYTVARTADGYRVMDLPVYIP